MLLYYKPLSLHKVWRIGTDKYSCRLESTIKCSGNYSPQFHFIGRKLFGRIYYELENDQILRYNFEFEGNKMKSQ